MNTAATYPLGWCIGKRNCSDCPGDYRSKIETDVVDSCICDCHGDPE